MAKRISSSQARAAVRRAQAKQKAAVRKANQAIDEYNRNARAHNAKVKRAVNDYNRAADAYNREVRTHNARRRQATNRYNQAVREYNRNPPRLRTTTRTTHIQSVQQLQESFTRLEASTASSTYRDLFDLSEREAANSAEAFSVLFKPTDQDEIQGDAEAEALRMTTITNELAVFSTDLDRRWRGALFALHRENPDAARHFCTSARETVGNLLLLAAPDSAVKEANPNYLRTPDGDVSRRARIHYCLANHGDSLDELVDFVEADIDNVIALFDDFNSATHGESGRFPLPELAALKIRVEDAIKFVYRLTQENN